MKPPPERLECFGVGGRPVIPPEYQIDWSAVRTVPEAMAAHQKYVASVRSREGIIVGYVVDVEGRLFTCSNNAKWLRDYYEGVPAGI